MGARIGDITLRQLRAVGAVAASGSITSAARALNLTQPAVTLQLRKLEMLAGLPLLQRSGEGMLLTDAGRELLRLAERIETALDDARDALEMMSQRTGGRVAVGAVSTAKYFIPLAIAAFARRRPGVQVKLSVGNRETIMQALRRYELDFAVMGRPPPDVAVERHLIGDHPHLIVTAPDHPLARARALSPHDLAGEVFLTRELGSGTRLLMERFFEDVGLTPTVGMEFDSNETIKQAVMAGLGIAFISAHTVAVELADGRLVAPPLPGLPVTRHWFVIRRSDKVLLPPAADAFDFMATEVARFLPRPPG